MKAEVIENVESKDDVTTDMEVVEVDDGLVELTDKSKNGEEMDRQKAKDVKIKEKKKEVEEIVLDSESEEEECVVVAGQDL